MGKIIIKILVIFFISVITISCVTMKQPTQQQLSSANYGELPANYKQQIHSYFDRRLIDPFSALYSFCQPFDAWMGQAIGQVASREAQFTYGKAVCGNVNSKNRMGGYTGGRLFWAFFTDGALTKIYIGSEASGPCRQHQIDCRLPEKRE